MATREDAVLVAIPLLALGGPAMARLMRVVGPTLGVGRLTAVPFTMLGALAALALIGFVTVIRPPTRR